MKRKLTVIFLATAFGVASAAPAVAVPHSKFGPGNSVKGPQDEGARCHPPGTKKDNPECKNP